LGERIEPGLSAILDGDQGQLLFGQSVAFLINLCDAGE